MLNPPTSPLAGTESDIDNNGVVLHLSMGEISFLLTADIGQEAEFELIARRAVPASTMLKVAHHGSGDASTSDFLAAVDPRYAVISVGAGNRFGHPDEAVLDRLGAVGEVTVLRTDEAGTVEFVTDGQRLWVRTGR